MATNRIHFLAHLVFAEDYLRENIVLTKGFFSPKSAAVVMANNAIQCWLPQREFGHFTMNEATMLISWCMFPIKSIRSWNENDIKNMPRCYARRASYGFDNEETIPAEMWRHNEKTSQNKKLYLHLIQDRAFDRFVHTVLNCKNCSEEKYKCIKQALEDGFYVRLARKYFQFTGTKANREWIENVMIPATQKAYSNSLFCEFAPYLTISDNENNLITNELWDKEMWPVQNWVIDQHIEWMLNDMYDALIELKVIVPSDVED